MTIDVTDHRPETDRDGHVVACPDCDNAGQLYVRELQRSDNRATNVSIGTDPVVCYDCSATFASLDELTERPTRERQGGGRPARYAGVTPDDLELDTLEFDGDG